MSRDYLALNKYFGIPGAKTKADRADVKVRASAASHMRKARKLAEAHERINIERESGGGWWVSLDDITEDDDPLDGAHFCSDGTEVLEAVETYITFLTTPPKENP